MSGLMTHSRLAAFSRSASLEQALYQFEIGQGSLLHLSTRSGLGCIRTLCNKKSSPGRDPRKVADYEDSEPFCQKQVRSFGVQRCFAEPRVFVRGALLSPISSLP